MALFSDTWAWEAQGRPSAPAGLRSPYLLHTCSPCLAPAASPRWANGTGNWNSGREETGSCPVHSSGMSPGALGESREGGMREVNHGAGEWTTVKHICISTMVMPPPLNAFSSVDRITKSWRWQKTSDDRKIAVESLVLGGGVWSHYWTWIQLICTYFL